MFVGTDAAQRDWKNKGKLRASNHSRNYEDYQKLKRRIWATITLQNDVGHYREGNEISTSI